MGAVESCCGQRAYERLPLMPTQPITALGDQYVTFNPEQPEMFRMAKKVWSQSTPFDVQDIHRNDWFKIEGKDAKWTGQKKLVLNTGVPHCTVERRNYSLWHFYVGHERRVTVRREAPNGRTVYLIMVHASPYPSRSSSDDAGAQVPMLVAHGDFLGSSYWFQEVNSAEQRRVARVELPEAEQASEWFSVAVAQHVDVALVLLATLVIDTCELEEAGGDGATGLASSRDSAVESARSDTWRHSLDPVPINMPARAGAVPVGASTMGGGVPPLWHKGKTPRA